MEMPEDEDKPITDYVEQRSKINGQSCGRRTEDKTKCIMCDYFVEKNTAAFNSLAQALEKSDSKVYHRFELLEKELHNYISIKMMGIVASVCSAVLVILIGIIMFQIHSNHNELMQINRAVAVIGAKQEGFVKVLTELSPEHKELMKHLNKNGIK
jgi:uncharacterized membrane protein YvbJ